MKVKYTSNKKAPSRLSDDKIHARYGIQRFLKSRGIMKKSEIENMINLFLIHKKFKSKSTTREFARYVFVSNRFQEFNQFVDRTLIQIEKELTGCPVIPKKQGDK